MSNLLFLLARPAECLSTFYSLEVFLYETKWSFLNNSEKRNALFSYNKCHVTAVLESLNSFNKRRFITEIVLRKPQFEIMSPLEYIFLSHKDYRQQSLQQ